MKIALIAGLSQVLLACAATINPPRVTTTEGSLVVNMSNVTNANPEDLSCGGVADCSSLCDALGTKCWSCADDGCHCEYLPAKCNN
ncbi:hypothetical protein B0T24DRAFT_681611 [Lasiosphaeria ovina]|uniref:Uncharacterized protein n=1 Tax=Lasiosphaeria ovina TaxID=92902 RepID=A0AAE0N3K3_9PEZI|nr:hypothetical protein B0T24DRAFT_681611 [Lasiosphaeria ovina]